MLMLSEVKGCCKNDISLDLLSACLKQLLKIPLTNDLSCTAELTENLLNPSDCSHKRALQTNTTTSTLHDWKPDDFVMCLEGKCRKILVQLGLSNLCSYSSSMYRSPASSTSCTCC